MSSKDSFEDCMKFLNKLRVRRVRRERWDRYFLRVADAIATGSKCVKRQVGAVLVDKNKRIIATGFNGKPRNTQMDHVCLREKIHSGESQEIICCLHAEDNVFLFADFSACQGGTLYITHAPCKLCAPRILQSGVKSLVFYIDDRKADGLEYIHKLIGNDISRLDIRVYDREENDTKWYDFRLGKIG